MSTQQQKTCEQCGRVGTQRFRTLKGAPGERDIVVCAAKKACRRRWPKRPVDDE